MKEVAFVGDSLKRIRAFPLNARQDAGYQIDKVQRGENPDNWKPVNTIGKGVKEIRIKEAGSQYRVVYLANMKDAVYVLHAFQKTTQKTQKSDIDLARKRFREIGS
jgi:phage-related protein